MVRCNKIQYDIVCTFVVGVVFAVAAVAIVVRAAGLGVACALGQIDVASAVFVAVTCI